MKVSPNLYSVTITDVHVWSYGSDEDKVEKLRNEFMEKQNKLRDFDFVTLTEFDPEKSSQDVIEKGTLVLSDEQILQLAINNVAHRVEQRIRVSVDITAQLMELANKPVDIAMKGGGDTYNNKCEVHMPNGLLAMYNDMLLLENCCTDELQGALNTGWRIIAACPQPDQRRPDYILGRFNPDKQNSDIAERAAQ